MDAEHLASELRAQLNGLSKLQYSVLTILLEQQGGNLTMTAGELLDALSAQPVGTDISIEGNLIRLELKRQHLN